LSFTVVFFNSSNDAHVNIIQSFLAHFLNCRIVIFVQPLLTRPVPSSTSDHIGTKVFNRSTAPTSFDVVKLRAHPPTAYLPLVGVVAMPYAIRQGLFVVTATVTTTTLLTSTAATHRHRYISAATAASKVRCHRCHRLRHRLDNPFLRYRKYDATKESVSQSIEEDE
jgi:hypothetical protein